MSKSHEAKKRIVAGAAVVTALGALAAGAISGKKPRVVYDTFEPNQPTQTVTEHNKSQALPSPDGKIYIDPRSLIDGPKESPKSIPEVPRK